MKEDPKNVKRMLNTVKGQLEGISKMIDNDAYCLDISNQLMASIAILRKVNIEILNAHLHHCVLEAASGDKEEKINEISSILEKVIK